MESRLSNVTPYLTRRGDAWSSNPLYIQSMYSSGYNGAALTTHYITCPPASFLRAFYVGKMAALLVVSMKIESTSIVLFGSFFAQKQVSALSQGELRFHQFSFPNARQDTSFRGCEATSTLLNFVLQSQRLLKLFNPSRSFSQAMLLLRSEGFYRWSHSKWPLWKFRS